jgi:hypothetical protein
MRRNCQYVNGTCEEISPNLTHFCCIYYINTGNGAKKQPTNNTASLYVQVGELKKRRRNFFRTFYLYKQWPFTLKEKKLQRLETVFGEIFRLNRCRASGKFGVLHNEQLRDLIRRSSNVNTVKSRLKNIGHIG